MLAVVATPWVRRVGGVSVWSACCSDTVRRDTCEGKLYPRTARALTAFSSSPPVQISAEENVKFIMVYLGCPWGRLLFFIFPKSSRKL